MCSWDIYRNANTIYSADRDPRRLICSLELSRKHIQVVSFITTPCQAFSLDELYFHAELEANLTNNIKI